MAIIDAPSAAVTDLKGLHLYHGDISNCSMRVRMTLIEKGLDWTSHHLDLRKKENVSEDYFAINPKGLVPALVHDGVVHVESNEIIAYLDKAFPDPPLGDVADPAKMAAWLERAGSIHLTAIKPYVYATKIQKRVKKTAEEQAKYEALQTDAALKAFHAQHAGQAEIDADDLAQPKAILASCFDALEAALDGQPWIMGDRFSLAEISWIPVHFVLFGCGYPFAQYPNITRWAQSIESRRSYQEGILKWCPDFSKV